MCTDVDCDIHTLINKIENENPEIKGWDCQIIQE